jgi:hypothetical protein
MREIKMIPVSSSQLESIGYDEERNELFVEFKKGKVYRYLDVPKTVYTNFLNAESFGSFFFHSVKGQFDYELINELVDDILYLTLDN